MSIQLPAILKAPTALGLGGILLTTGMAHLPSLCAAPPSSSSVRLANREPSNEDAVPVPVPPPATSNLPMPTTLAGETLPPAMPRPGMPADPGMAQSVPPRVYFPKLTARYHAEKVPRKAWTHWGYPENFAEPVLGAAVAAPVMIQIANGQAAQMVLYDYDFLPPTSPTALSQRGRRQLQKVITLAEQTTFPIIIQASLGNEAQDDARREFVIGELAKYAPWIPEMRVVVADPSAAGLSGTEAAIIYSNMLGRTAAGGGGASGGGGGGTGGGTLPAFGLGAGIGAGLGSGS